MIVHSFERNFATGEIAITTPVDTNTGEIPPALLADDIGKPGELHHLCGGSCINPPSRTASGGESREKESATSPGKDDKT